MKHRNFPFYPRFRFDALRRTSFSSYYVFPFSIFHFSFLIFLSSCTEIFSPDITDHSLIVNSPSDSLYTSANTIAFWWEKDIDIEQYEFRLTYTTSGNLNLLLDTAFVGNTYNYAFASDNAYHWQVRGKNEGSETVWIERELFVDRTSPDKATATHMNGDTLATGATDTLQWFSADFPLNGTNHPVTDSLILYRKNDSLTIGGKWYFTATDPRMFQITATSPSPLNGPGTYYWRIVTIDKAGNRQTSDRFQFVVQ
jgi:hypothetical protein